MTLAATVAPLTGTPVLTTLALDPDHPRVRADAADLCRAHARVLSLLGLDPEDPKPRELWAWPRPDRLVVQWHRPLDLSRLPPGYALDTATGPVRLDWPVGARVRWALVANPVSRTGARPATGARATTRDLRTTGEITGWATVRLGGALSDLEVWVDAHRPMSGTRDGRRVTHRWAWLRGSGTVADPEALAGAIAGGVGRARAYGCGLLLVTEPPVNEGDA
jgi:CRISPR system Cascade subunit CasE